MVPGVVGGESVPSLEGLVTDNARVGHIKMSFHMTPHPRLVRHSLATGLAHILSWPFSFHSLEHRFQKLVQV